MHQSVEQIGQADITISDHILVQVQKTSLEPNEVAPDCSLHPLPTCVWMKGTTYASDMWCVFLQDLCLSSPYVSGVYTLIKFKCVTCDTVPYSSSHPGYHCLQCRIALDFLYRLVCKIAAFIRDPWTIKYHFLKHLLFIRSRGNLLKCKICRQSFRIFSYKHRL